MKTFLQFAILGLFALAGTACNTVAGAGQDIENTGEAIEGTANDYRY